MTDPNYPTFCIFDPNLFSVASASKAVLAAEACLSVASARTVAPGHKYALSIIETCYVAHGAHAIDFLDDQAAVVPHCPLLTEICKDDDFIRIATSASDAIWVEFLSGGFTARAAYCASIGMTWDDYYTAWDEWYEAKRCDLPPAPLMDAIEDRLMDDDAWTDNFRDQ